MACKVKISFFRIAGTKKYIWEKKGKKYKDLLTFVLLEGQFLAGLIFFLASTVQSNLEFSKLEEKFWIDTSIYHLLTLTAQGVQLADFLRTQAISQNRLIKANEAKKSQLQNIPTSSPPSGRKNVLRKLLRISYRRLKAGFFVC